jgi:hypothetical protein
MRSFSIKAALAALLMSTSIAGAHTASPLPTAQTHAAQTHLKLSHRRLSRGADTTRTASKPAPHFARKHDLPKSEAYPNRDWFPMAAEFNQGINGL